MFIIVCRIRIGLRLVVVRIRLGLTLSQMTNFRLFQTQSVCRRQFWTLWKWQKVLQTGRKYCGIRRNYSLLENTVGKEEIACYMKFVLFPQFFQKTCTCENQRLFGKGLKLPVDLSCFIEDGIFWFTAVCMLSFFITIFSATISDINLKLGMVLQLGVLHVAYWIQVRQSSTSCFLTWFILGKVGVYLVSRDSQISCSF